ALLRMPACAEGSATASEAAGYKGGLLPPTAKQTGEPSMFQRSYDRGPREERPVTIEPGFLRHAEGSALISFGETRVICTASVEPGVPGWLRGSGQGWITAEYGMLPRSTHTRSDREAARGRQGGRTQEIQRLIGRSLRACVDMKQLGEQTI